MSLLSKTVCRALLCKSRCQSGAARTDRAQPCDFERWADVAIKLIVGSGDRLFPVGFQRRIARERLGVEADEIAGGHLVALSNPAGVARQLHAYV